MNVEMVMIRKKVVVLSSKILFENLSGWTEGNHENTASWLRAQIPSRVVTATPCSVYSLSCRG